MKQSSLSTFALLASVLLSTGSFAQHGWNEIFAGNQQFWDMEFTTPFDGWAIAGLTTFDLWRSTDGGETWNGVVPRAQFNGTNIELYDLNHGIICDAWRVLLTNDAFESWRIVEFHSPMGDTTINSAAYLDADHLIGVGATGEYMDYSVNLIYTSDDGGVTWTLQLRDSCAGLLCPFQKVSVSVSGTAIVGFLPNRVVRGIDGGHTWSIIEDLPIPSIYNVESSANGVFYVCGWSDTDGNNAYPMIARSLDDGLSWQLVWSEPTLNATPLWDIEFPDSMRGWVVGGDGLMVHTEDGGTTWTHFQLETSNVGFGAVTFVDTSLGWAVDGGGGLPTRVFRYGTPTDIQSGYPILRPSSQGLVTIYPNPFNSSTRISFTLPHPAHVALSVFDVTGRQVAALMNGNMNAGEQHVSFNASELPSGIYFARLNAGTFSQTQKLLLLR